MITEFTKRLCDVLIALSGMVLLWPLFILVSLAIKLDDGGIVFFRQQRVGLHGEPFTMYKFRTMVEQADKIGKPLTVGQDPRITRVGQWLRKYKLDELPQLLNVLKGEMSLVGPRPEVPKYVALYTPEQRQVLEIKPGITDPASIRFRAENDLLAQVDNPEAVYISDIMPEKIKINLAYARQSNLFTDAKVIVDTLIAVVLHHQ